VHSRRQRTGPAGSGSDEQNKDGAGDDAGDDAGAGEQMTRQRNLLRS